ncbi:DUF4347 domain-containing protein [Hydrogenophaga sp. NH-16]|uniref:DUF4347 domain-containing protein n=1 Tax=Hydrogenophaga sp. NH-16 TaxID=2184519 RepID=UPI0013E3E46F|nr:DUF4347 domain-containing protein [Hydrogenophaga sp. NH-16]
MALEPRLLFDGAGAVAAADVLPDQAAPEPSPPQPSAPDAAAPEVQGQAPVPGADEPQPANASGDTDENEVPTPSSTTAAADDEGGIEGEGESAQGSDAVDNASSQADAESDDDTDPPALDAPEERFATLVVVDARVAEQEGFTLDLPANVMVRVVERDESGLDAISRELANDAGRQYDTIHIISHGTPGSLMLGNEVIGGGSLSEAQREMLRGWAPYLTDEADILLYGCDLAADSEGEAFITELAHLTGADIAASTDATGAADKGGDWDLELSTGAIEATALSVAGFNSLLTAAPTVTITGLPTAGEVLIGEDFTFSLNFSNPGTAPNPDGFGPYIDLFLPLGADGNDGVTIATSGAITYLGTPVNYQLVTIGAGGTAEHPYFRDNTNQPGVINGQPGQTVVVIELPFGSYTNGQPEAELVVQASLSNLADRGTGLEIAARAGFRFGQTPTADYANDPSVEGGMVTASITPVLMEYTHTFNGPEGETATGPNFPREMTTTITVAAGQTLTDYSLVIDVPGNIVVTGINGVSLGAPVTGGTLSHPVGDISGTQAVTIQYYVPDVDAASANVLDPVSGSAGTVQFQVSGTGDWDPLDARDTEETVDYDPAGVELQHTIRSLAVQKEVENITPGGQNSPGQTLEYTINFQVSDYFRFDDVVITDVIDDGHTPTGTPTLTLTHQGTPVVVSLAGYFTDVTDPSTHNITRTFDISEALRNAGLSGDLAQGILTGGKFNGVDLGGTFGVITYTATIDNTFESPVGGGDAQINHGDRLATSAVITGTVVQANGDQGSDVQDSTATDVEIASGGLTLEIVGINGAASGGSAGIRPGDTVTYELTYDLGTGDFEHLKLDAFLPKPVFDVGDPGADGTSSGWAHGSVGTSATYPGPGEWVLIDGAGNVIDINGTASLSVAAGSNGLSFDLGSREDSNNLPTQVVIRFTVRVNDSPFADGLYLTTQAEASENNTPGESATHQDSIQLQLNEPHLEIRHGVVSHIDSEGDNTLTGTTGSWSSPGTTGASFAGTISDISGIDGNITGIDAGDRVRFGVGVINTGGHGAFDIRSSVVTPPPGFAFTDAAGNIVADLAAANLQLRLGDGTLLVAGTHYTVVGGVLSTMPGVYLEAGRGDAVVAGSNVLVITYDTVAVGDIAAGLDTTSTVSVVDYSNRDGGVAAGNDFLPGTNVISDDAAAAAKAPEVRIVFQDGGISPDDSSAGHTTGANMVIGESMVYDIVVTLPEGTTHDLKVDALVPPGMRLDTSYNGVGYEIITVAGAGGSGALTSNFAGTLGVPTVTGDTGAVGEDPRFSFGNVTTTDNNSSGDNSFVIRVRAIVANTVDNQGDTTRDMATGLVYDDGGADTNTVVSGTGSPTITIREPQLTIVKEVDTDLVTAGNQNTPIDAGDSVAYTTTISNTSGVDAFDLTFSDVFPSVVNPDTGTLQVMLTDGGGSYDVTGAFQWVGNELRISDGANLDLLDGQSLTITVTASTNATVAGVTSFDSDAVVRWSSIDSASNNDGVRDGNERDGSDGEGPDATTLNNYVASDGAPVNVAGEYILSRVGGLADTAAPGDTAADAQDVAVGEIVRFRLVMRVPEGNIDNLNITPNLPPGYELLDTGATWALVGNGGGFNVNGAGAGNGISGNSADNIENSLNSGNTAGAGTRPGIGIIPNGSGVFVLGDIENLDRDADGEYLILEFNAVVRNVAGNTAGTDLVTTVTVRSGATELGESNGTTDNVVEPQISAITKDVVDTAPGAQGATSTITVRNAFNTGSTDAAPAYDVVLTDDFPSGESGSYVFERLVVGGTAYTSADTAAAAAAGITWTVGATGVSVNFDRLAPGTSVELRYTVGVPTNAEQSATAPTNATVTWSSLPDGAGTISSTGFAGSTVGTDASASGERDGSGTAPNTYTRSDPAGYGTINGVLWDDTNDRDGAIDGGEFRLANQTVELRWAGADGIFGNADDRVMTTTTNASGEYSFGALPGTGLVSGNYRITTPATVTLTIPGGAIADDTDALSPRWDADAGTLGTISVTLGEGTTSVNRNVGYLQVNDTPVVTITNGSVTFVEGVDRTGSDPLGEDRDVLGAPVNLGPVTITDPELHRDPGQLDNFSGTTLTIGRSNATNDGFNAASEDVLGFNDPALVSGSNLVVGGSTVGSFTNVGGQLVITFNASADAAAINTVASAISYANRSDTPPANVTLRFRFDDANDNSKQGSGGALTGDATIVVNITAQNDPPDATNNANSVTESDGQPTPGASVSGNLRNDNDGGNGVDSDPETALADLVITEIGPVGGTTEPIPAGGVTVNGQYGALTIHPDGSYTYVLNESHPDVNSLGTGNTLTDVFDYTLADADGLTDSAALTITINGRTDGGGATPPTIGPEDENGTDDPADPSTQGQNSVYEAGLGDAGDDRESTTGDIVVAAPDGIRSVTVGGTAFTYAELQDISDGVLTPVSIDTGEGTLVITGIRGVQGPTGAPTQLVIEYEYTLKDPVAHSGPYTDDIALQVTDNKPTPQTASGTLTIAIINDLPAATDDTNSVTEGNTVTGDVLGNDDSGADGWTGSGNGVVGVVAGDNGGTPTAGGTGTAITGTYGTLTLNPDGSYTYVANAGITVSNPVDVFTYTVRDADGDETTATLTIDLNNIPDPVASLPPQVGVDADGGINIPTSGGFVDIDGDPLTYTATDLPPGLTIDPNTGVITGTLDNSASQGGNTGTPGVYEVTVMVTDPHGQTASQTFTYTVTNPAPVARDDTRTTREDTPVSGNVIGNGGRGDVADSDPDGDDLTVTEIVVNGRTYTFGPGTPSHTITLNEGRLVFREDGNYTFTPRPDWNGRVPPVTYTISDGEGGTATAVLRITVTPVPDIVPDTSTTERDTPVRIPVLDNDDFEGRNPRVTGTTPPANGTVTINPDGSITYMPNPGFVGTDTFTYTVTSGGVTETTTVTVQVLPGTQDGLPPDRSEGSTGPGLRPGPYFPDPWGPGLPQVGLSFESVTYVRDAVVASQNERALGGDARATSRIDLAQPYDSGVRVPGMDLGMDPALFVQQAVRDSQRLADFMNSLVQGRLSRVSLGADHDLATPELYQPDADRLVPQPASQEKGDAARPTPEPQKTSEVDAEVEEAAAAAMPAQAMRMAPSFTDQLRNGTGRLPMSTARV